MSNSNSTITDNHLKDSTTADPGAVAGDHTVQPTAGEDNKSSEPQSSGAGDDNPTGDCSGALARGISTMLASVIRDFDSKALDVSRSQDQLSSAIDRLTGELDQLLEDAPLPFIMQHAVKISSVRKRVSSLNLVLKSIQRRLDNMDRMLSTAMPHEKANAGSPKQL